MFQTLSADSMDPGNFVLGLSKGINFLKRNFAPILPILFSKLLEQNSFLVHRETTGQISEVGVFPLRQSPGYIFA